MKNILEVKKLYWKASNQQILDGLSLSIEEGKIHVLMGPNGSGKSTLAKVLMGDPDYSRARGQILFLGKDIKRLSADARARKGMFLGFQYPVEVPGVNILHLLHQIAKIKQSINQFVDDLKLMMKDLHIKEAFLDRTVNSGFSGGEKKKFEILQMIVLQPKIIILDEIDSGLDVDALKIVSKAINKYRPKDSAVLIITHYQRILKYLNVDKVHVMIDGRIVESGDASLAKRVESGGYGQFKS